MALNIISQSEHTTFGKAPHGNTLGNVKQEMNRLNVNILALCESRWSNNDFVSDNHRFIYGDGEEDEKKNYWIDAR